MSRCSGMRATADGSHLVAPLVCLLDEANCDYLGSVHKSQEPFSEFETIVPSTNTFG
jgi:hypothetical protein